VSFGGGLPPGDEDWGIVRADASDWLARGQTRIADLASLPLRGAHNALNMMAACALVESWVSTTIMNSALGTFAGLPHRMQTVAQIDGVTYIDDSKATNLGAALAALEVMPLEDAVLLIAGGDAKGVDLTTLAPAMRGRVRFVATLGRDGPAVGRVAAAAGLSHLDCDSIEAAVAACRARARSGDTVLLSPACASIDMFTSYRERGERFAAAARGGARG
jgi:UDP-N-acetylmuramoylalanine--D-glutamate ligase